MLLVGLMPLQGPKIQSNDDPVEVESVCAKIFFFRPIVKASARMTCTVSSMLMLIPAPARSKKKIYARKADHA
jgi:hypothetical protein